MTHNTSTKRISFVVVLIIRKTSYSKTFWFLRGSLWTQICSFPYRGNKKEKKNKWRYFQFGDGLKKALKDILVHRNSTQSVQKKLLTKANLPSKNGVEIVVSMETATSDTKNFIRGKGRGQCP